MPQGHNSPDLLVLDAGLTTPFLIVNGEGDRVLAPYETADGPTLISPQDMVRKGLISDFNGCGCVDASQAGIMFNEWGRGGRTDVNLDGIVDAADAGYMFAEWSGDSTPFTVPEAAGRWLWAGSLLALALRRHR